MGAIDSVVLAISNILYQPWCVPLILIGGAIYLTFRCGFLQIGMFREACKVIMEKPHEGGVSSFGALMVSTASRVGTGNIIGVSTAIVCGGPGAIFWMWITAFFGGASAFVESTLAQIYKKKDDDGTFKGGPAFYMRDALGQKWLGVIFSIFIIFTYMIGYNMLAAYNLQSTFAVFDFYNETSTPAIIGLILMILFGVIVFSWGIAFLEYCCQVPANRIGFVENGGPFNLIQLKVIQECISLAVFCIIANIMFQGTHLHWNHILAFFLIICAVYLVFMDK